VLATLSLTVTVSYGVLVYAYPVLLEPMERDLDLSRGQTSAALSLAFLVSAVVALPAGRWLDRRSPRRLMTTGSLLATGALIGWASVGSLWQLYADFAALGVAMALVLYDPAFAVIAKLFHPSPRRALTVLTLFGGLAAIIFTPLTQWLVQASDWRAALVALALIAAVTTVLPNAAFLPGWKLASTAADVADPRRPPTSSLAQDSVEARTAIRDAAFWSLTFALFVGYFLSVAILVHLIPYLTERDFSPGFAALAAGLVGLMQIPGRALMWPLERRITRSVLTTAIFGLQALALLLLQLANSVVVVLIFVIWFGMVRGMVPLARATLLAEFYGPASYGTISGVVGFFTALAQALAPGGVGLLYDQFHGYGESIWLMFAAGAIATLAAFWAERRAPVVS
jgi:predicted MFS family arabinose efflux permease